MHRAVGCDGIAVISEAGGRLLHDCHRCRVVLPRHLVQTVVWEPHEPINDTAALHHTVDVKSA
jgi:hypothetical protein